jgi:hypothetical protein
LTVCSVILPALGSVVAGAAAFCLISVGQVSFQPPDSTDVPAGPENLANWLARFQSHACANFNAIRSWAKDFSPPIRLVASTLLGAAVYLALRAHQLGAATALNRVSWPEMVAAASRWGFGGVVIGNGGTGKTTLLDYLYQTHVQSQLAFFRQAELARMGGLEFVKKYYEERGGVGGTIAPYKVTGATKEFVVGYRRALVDTPGQAWRVPVPRDPNNGTPACREAEGSAWSPRLCDAMASDHCLIVNVMTYGYGAAIRGIPIYTKFESRLEDYKKMTRDDEVRALKHAIDEIEHFAAKRPHCKHLTFVNLVNMGGFWWRDEAEVRTYYCDTLKPEWERLEGIAGRMGLRAGRDFELAPYVPVSLLYDDMTTESDGSEGACRRQIFCVEQKEATREALVARTVAAVDALERTLYGQSFLRAYRLAIKGHADV